MVAPYNWKDRKNRLLKMLRMSKKMKEKKGWSRESGAGFIEDDIKFVSMSGKLIKIEFSWGNQDFKVNDLNLRETEELLKWVEKNNINQEI